MCITALARRVVLIKPPPPPPPTHSPCRILAIFNDLGQKRGPPPFRSLKVLQLDLDSFCDHVRIFRTVIRHLEAELGFWLFPRKWWKYRRAQIFWQVVPVQQPIQYGRDAAHISWAAWVFRSLEDYMKERQHHLNESSSARLGGSQQVEILPSPNSKQTQSLGAWFSDGRTAWAPRFLISAVIFIRRRDFNVRLVSIVYYVAQ